MKKPLNAFRHQQSRNLVRWLIIFCAVIVIAAAALLISFPEGRFSLLGLGETGLQSKTPPAALPTEAGLSGSAVVNADAVVRPVAADDHILGDVAAPVQIIVYEDFQCPFCLRFYDTLEQARREYGSRLTIIMRHYPLANHNLALPAATAAECAAAQGKFEEAYHALFAANKAATLSQEFFQGLGKQLGVDEGLYSDCLTKAPYTDKILAEKEEVKKLGVIGTPAAFVNGEYLSGALPYEDFTYPDGTKGEGLKAVIDRKLAEKK